MSRPELSAAPLFEGYRTEALRLSQPRERHSVAQLQAGRVERGWLRSRPGAFPASTPRASTKESTPPLHGRDRRRSGLVPRRRDEAETQPLRQQPIGSGVLSASAVEAVATKPLAGFEQVVVVENPPLGRLNLVWFSSSSVSALRRPWRC
jgi:hypothetical protein